MKSLYLIFFLIGMFAITSISCNKKNNTNDKADLLKKWILFSVQNTKTHQIINFPDTTLSNETITFTDTLTSIYGACGNHGQACYKVNNEFIMFSNFSIFHLNFCSLYKWEDFVLNNLDSAFQYNVKTNQLVVYSKGSYNLIFIPFTSK
jgi:hypothetical protein